MSWRLDDLPTFVAVVDQGGVSAAARHLGLPKSSVSKALSRIEADLGLRLLERNSRNLRITADGQVFLEHARNILDRARDAEAAMTGRAAAPQGRLTVALPLAFAREVVGPALPAFRQCTPGVSLDILVTSHPVDLIRDSIDLAVVVGEQADSELVVKPLYRGTLRWVASPDYAKGKDLSGGRVEDLLPHIQASETRYARADFPIRVHGQPHRLDLSRRPFRASDPLTVRAAVRAGLGVACLPWQYCARDVAQGRLVEVFPEIHPDLAASTLSAVFPSRRHLPSRTRAFLDFLVEICARLP